MKCPSCKADLPFTEEFYKTIVACPLCGAPIKHEPPKPVKRQPQTAEEYLADMVETEGAEIFSQSKMDLLYKYLSKWPDKLCNERDRILLLCMRNIPESLYAARNSNDLQKGDVVRQAAYLLNGAFCIPVGEAISMVSLVMNALTPTKKSCSSIVKPQTGKALIRDRIYKTVQIGNALWMAENLKIDSSYNSYLGNPANFEEYGGLYTGEYIDKFIKANLDGWRIPTKADFLQLISAAGGAVDAAKNLGAIDQWPFKTTDQLGFSALPAGYRTSTGNYYYLGHETVFWGRSGLNLRLLEQGARIEETPNEYKCEFSIRLVRNLAQ